EAVRLIPLVAKAQEVSKLMRWCQRVVTRRRAIQVDVLAPLLAIDAFHVLGAGRVPDSEERLLMRAGLVEREVDAESTIADIDSSELIDRRLGKRGIGGLERNRDVALEHVTRYV